MSTGYNCDWQSKLRALAQVLLGSTALVLKTALMLHKPPECVRNVKPNIHQTNVLSMLVYSSECWRKTRRYTCDVQQDPFPNTEWIFTRTTLKQDVNRCRYDASADRCALTNEFRFGAIIPFGEQLCWSCAWTKTATSEMCLTADRHCTQSPEKLCYVVPRPGNVHCLYCVGTRGRTQYDTHARTCTHMHARMNAYK